MDHNNKINRRTFLGLMGSTASFSLLRSPIALMVEAIIAGAHQKAIAATHGLSPRKYVHILQQGAPPRWTFDLFLTPYSANGFVASPQLGTTYLKSGPNTNVVYNTVSKNGIQVPSLWQFSVPAANGGLRVMDPLLDNLLQLRGIQVKNPDHGAAQSLQFIPLGSAHSISALSADASSAPIPAINLSLAEYKFKSIASKAAVTVVNGGNMLSTLLTPFVRNNSVGFEAKRVLASAALDEAISALNQAATNSNLGAASLASSHKAASDLLSTGFGNLTSIWTTLYNKYASLVTRSLDTTIAMPGINDQVIATDGTGKYQINTNIVTSSDIRNLMTASTTVPYLAAHFAVAEYVLLNNLSDSISIGPGNISNLTVNSSNTSLFADEHGTSAVVSLILNSYMNRAYAACLLELIDQLKAKSLFNETVIVMGGEFGRSARKDGLGSDHGYLGSSSCIYSGVITGPIILGNIYNNQSQDSSDGGTWGNGAPVTELGRPLNLSDWTSTIAYLLRVPSPVTSGSSVLTTNSDGSIGAAIEKAKQI